VENKEGKTPLELKYIKVNITADDADNNSYLGRISK
jgi:hypothetical protein